MKLLVVFTLTFFSLQSFALDSCSSVFLSKEVIAEQKLSVVELAALYHKNYLNSPEGKAQVARMEKLLNTKYEIRRHPDGKPYYQVVYEPKEAVKESTLIEITSTIPNLTIVYDLNPPKKN